MRLTSLLAGLTLCAAVAVAGPASNAHATAGHGRIVFSADRTGSFQLYTVRLDGTGLRQITDRAGADLVNADWSPDGRRIVFELGTESGGQIARVNADGSGFTVLPIAGQYVGQPSFGRDGRRIYFDRFDGVSEAAIFTAKLDGTDDRRITRPPTGTYDTDPNVSPDGKRLSFVRTTENPNAPAALFVVDLASGRETQLTTYEANVAIKHDWAPDGRRLTFTRDGYERPEGVSSNVRTIRPDGRKERAVTAYAGGEVNAFVGSYAPDGRWIVFRKEQGTTFTLVKVRPNGRQATPILSVPGLAPRYIDWGPAAS